MPDYTLLRERRRSLLLTLDEGGKALVRAPLALPKTEIDRFVRSRARWLAKRQARLAQRPAHSYLDGEPFPFSGRTLCLRREAGARRVRLEGDALVVPEGDAAATRALLTSWYKAQAKALFKERLAALSAQTGITPETLRLSDAKTRWGSCGAKGGVNLNWRLALAPPEILDYVIVHELCHLRERNHSAAFWALVTRFCPEWKERRRWLAEHGEALDC